MRHAMQARDVTLRTGKTESSLVILRQLSAASKNFDYPPQFSTQRSPPPMNTKTVNSILPTV
jgi:hypothetical protein